MVGLKLLEELTVRVLRAHPNVVLFMLVIAAGVIGYSYKVFAETVELERLELKHDTEFASLSRKISYGFAEIKLRTIEGEIFSLESSIQRGEEISPRDYQRLSTLRSDHSGLSRQLRQIESGDEI